MSVGEPGGDSTITTAGPVVPSPARGPDDTALAPPAIQQNASVEPDAASSAGAAATPAAAGRGPSDGPSTEPADGGIPAGNSSAGAAATVATGGPSTDAAGSTIPAGDVDGDSGGRTADERGPGTADRTGSGAGVRWQAPRTWRVLLALARFVVMPIARLRVTGDVPAHLRNGPIIFAVNHIGPFDPVAVTAACRVARLAPRLMATGGLFRAPVVGPVMRAAGHIRINRRQADVAAAVDDVTAALAVGSHVLGYPEGRITLDPGMWPERGKTGLARIALATGVPVVAVAQWGAHEVAAWGGFGPTVATLCRSLVRRPVVRVHFGAVVDLSGISPSAPGAAQRATDRIIDAITAQLRPLRVDEPRLPRYVDPVRPLSLQRRHRPAS